MGEELSRNDQFCDRRRELDFGKPLRRELEQHQQCRLLFQCPRSGESERAVRIWPPHWRHHHESRIQHARFGNRHPERSDADRQSEVLQACRRTLVEIRRRSTRNTAASGPTSKASSGRIRGLPDLLSNTPSSLNVSFGQGEYTGKIVGVGNVHSGRLAHPSATDVESRPALRLLRSHGRDAEGRGRKHSCQSRRPQHRQHDRRRHSSRRQRIRKRRRELRSPLRISLTTSTATARPSSAAASGVLFSPQMMASLWSGVHSPLAPRRVVFSRQDAIKYGLKYPLYNDDFRAIVERQIKEEGFHQRVPGHKSEAAESVHDALQLGSAARTGFRPRDRNLLRGSAVAEVPSESRSQPAGPGHAAFARIRSS